MIKLTVPIASQDYGQAEKQIRIAQAAGAGAIELRTDYIENINTDLVQKLIFEAKNSANPLPLIVTCRDKRQGGKINYPLHLRIDVLCTALKAGADFVDFEYENFLSSTTAKEKLQRALSEKPNSRLILSAHNFKTKFDDINRLFRHIQTLYPAAIPKLVYTANHINDCFDAFDLLRRTSNERIAFCMGAAGLISRIIAKKLDSFVTFACLDDKSATAPGQLTIEQFKNLYHIDKIDSDTQLYGIIGSPVAHSLSPAVHNACFAQIKANKLYLPLLVEGGKDEFERFLEQILIRPWLGFKGFSVTIPHKQNALNFVKGKRGFIDPLAEKIGAANTLTINGQRATSDERRVSAYNTDYTGALKAITSTLGITKARLKKLSIAVIGAGGVARAVVAGLSDADAKVKIYNRTVKKAEKLAAEFNCDFAPLKELSSVEADLLINCTSIGMHPDVDSTPMPKEFLKKDTAVFDTVYNPPQTLLLKQAVKAGAKTISGLDMFINQAKAQFRLFTSRNAKTDLMRKTIVEKLNQ